MIHRLLPSLLTLLLTLSLTVPVAMAGADDEGPRRDEKQRDADGHDKSKDDGGKDRDHDRDRDRDRDHDRRHRPLSPEQVDAALEILRRIDAGAAERIVKLRTDHPDQVDQEVRRWFPKLEYFLAIRRWDPQMYELRIEDFRLAHESRGLAEKLIKARRDDDPKENELASRLEKLIEQHFDVRQKMRERELTRLEERIERLREQLDERADDRKDLIEQRMKELTLEGEETQW